MEFTKISFAAIILFVVIAGIGLMTANDPWWFLRKSLWQQGKVWNNREPSTQAEPFFWQ